jgi:hypothetical protein
MNSAMKNQKMVCIVAVLVLALSFASLGNQSRAVAGGGSDWAFSVQQTTDGGNKVWDRTFGGVGG